MKNKLKISLISIGLLLVGVSAALAVAPLPPTGFTATSTSATQVSLNWSAPADATAIGYKIYQNGIQIATNTPATSTALVVNNLTPATTYTFGVASFNSGAETSGQATTSVMTLADTAAPSVPAGLTAIPASLSQINLSWTASTDNVGVAGYQVFRNGGQIATTTATSYQDTGLAATTTYNYNVAAFDAAGNVSGLSSPASATTQSDTTAPSVPTGLAATPVLTSQINLTWTASTDNVGVAGYRVYRNGAFIASSASTSYASTGLTASTTYNYNVSAVDAAGNESALSATTSATTLSSNPLPTGANVQIQVRGGDEREPRLINLGSNAKVKVIVFGSSALNVRDIKPRTVKFAGAGAVGWSLKDVNRDRILDRVFDFRARNMADLKNASGTVEVTLTGETKDGSTIVGKATVRVKNPAKEKRDREELKKKLEALKRENEKKMKELRAENDAETRLVKQENKREEQQLKQENKKQEQELRKENKKTEQELKKASKKK